MSHHATAVARKLQNIATEIGAFMQSPTFWNHFRAIHEDSDIGWEPDLLGDRLQRLLKEPLTDLRAECLVSGLGDVSRDLMASVKATINYLNAASDFLNGAVPSNCPPRNVIPEEVCRDYTLFQETPVDELLVLLCSIAVKLQPQLNEPANGVVTSEELAAIAGCSGKLIRDTLTSCEAVKKGNRSGATEWMYQTILPKLREAESPTVKAVPWPESFALLSSTKIPAKK